MSDAGTAANTTMPETSVTKRRLRIAVVTETYPPEVNGVAQTIAKVVEGLCAEGHELTLVRPSQGEPLNKIPQTGVSQVFVTGVPVPRYGQLKMGLPAMNRLTRLWRAQRPDVVHIVTEGPLGLSALAAAQRLGLPIASEFRTNFHTYCRHYGLGWLTRPILGYLRWFHNRTSCTMVPTRALADELTAQGFDNLCVVARGVDTTRFDPAKRSAELRAAWGATPDTLVALYVGRLADEKNIPVVLNAFEQMQKVRPDSRLVLVGDGPARAALQRRCPAAVFAGVRKGEELARHYASGDVFLFPSLTETFGNVTPEALASGLAVLAFNHAAASELITHGDNGLRASAGDHAEFIRHAVDLARRASELHPMRRQARASVLRLSWPRIIGDIEQVYTALRKPAVHESVHKAEESFPTPNQADLALRQART
jgi:glycosyltransferase involved in cell wall biosynthesis